MNLAAIERLSFAKNNRRNAINVMDLSRWLRVGGLNINMDLIDFAVEHRQFDAQSLVRVVQNYEVRTYVDGTVVVLCNVGKLN